MVNLVKKLGTYGISTIIDFHQDVLSAFYCGEGCFPQFLIAHRYEKWI